MLMFYFLTHARLYGEGAGDGGDDGGKDLEYLADCCPFGIFHTLYFLS